MGKSCTHYYISYEKPIKTCCITQGTLLIFTCQPGWEEDLGYMCMYGYMYVCMYMYVMDTCICMTESLPVHLKLPQWLYSIHWLYSNTKCLKKSYLKLRLVLMLSFYDLSIKKFFLATTDQKRIENYTQMKPTRIVKF